MCSAPAHLLPLDAQTKKTRVRTGELGKRVRFALAGSSPQTMLPAQLRHQSMAGCSAHCSALRCPQLGPTCPVWGHTLLSHPTQPPRTPLPRPVSLSQ